MRDAVHDWPATEAFFAELAERLAKQEEVTRRLGEQVDAYFAVPLAEPVVDKAADTIGPGDTPLAIPMPTPRAVPAPPQLLPDGFHLYDALAAMPTALVSLDAEGRVRLWNPAAAELFGWGHVEVVGALPPFLPHDQALDHQRLLARVRAGVAVREVVVVRRTKSSGTVKLIASASSDASGGIVFTFRKWAGLADAPAPMPPVPRTAPHRKLETLGRLLAAVAHDFNNVLAVVCGHAELLGDRLPPGGPERESVQMIRAASDHAAALTRRLLGYAKPAAAAVPLDVNDTVRGISRLLRGVAGGGIRTVIRTPRDAGTILADAAQVEQVLLNLTANAKDAMPSGGTFAVRTSRVVVRGGRAGWPAHCPDGPYACLIVSDTGTGIDPRTRERIFDAYFTTKGAHGTGIGLATVVELVEGLRGHIECDSEPWLGTVFRVYLPAI